MQRWQAEIVLELPDVALDDQRFDGMMRGWAERLAVAVDAGIITNDQAHRTWVKAVELHAA